MAHMGASFEVKLQRLNELYEQKLSKIRKDRKRRIVMGFDIITVSSDASAAVQNLMVWRKNARARLFRETRFRDKHKRVSATLPGHTTESNRYSSSAGKTALRAALFTQTPETLSLSDVKVKGP